MSTPLRVLCSLCWAVVGTYLVSWFILGTPNLLQLHWIGKVYILVVGSIAWKCIDKGWDDMRRDDQLHSEDRKTKQSEKLIQNLHPSVEGEVGPSANRRRRSNPSKR